MRAQAEVRTVLGAMGADVLDREFPLARAHQAFDGAGRLGDRDLDAALAGFVVTLVRHGGLSAAAGRPQRVSDSAAYSRECQHVAS